ncbi:related to monooxygenase [Phialocephala subalpina]|uniref:Related to monooxygenase n=1 Tax=Phialocephala subalpina TaxID=576137 RepID=A0A1L7XYJ1_9HELO|nr:related to monooxygenase [Phialocephala subalpina]
MSLPSPVIIIGTGVVGLCLAQSLKQHGIPFEIYERDPYIERAKGWGLTIHWALPALQSCLPASLYDRLSTIQVDPQQGIKDTGRFLFLDLSTAKPKFVIPPSKRLRVNRIKFRSLLAEDIDVKWDKRFESYRLISDGEVEVTFTDGTTTRGSLLVGADGSSSKIRNQLMGHELGKLHQLPVRFIGVTLRLTPSQVQPLREIDPLLFQGCHPESGVLLWYSTLSTPEVNGSSGEGEYYEGQLNISWMVKSESDEVPVGNKERVLKMRELARGFEKRLLKLVMDIPEDEKVLEIKLQDWPTLEWPSNGGLVTLVGDAAHAMTMYRGEAANHGMTDAALLSEKIVAINDGKISREEVIQSYEKSLRERTHDAVLLSRQACLDAHDLNALTADSPLVSKRAKVLQPGIAVA